MPANSTRAHDLYEFVPAEMFPQGFTSILYGLRRCGKNVMMEYMMYEMRKRLKGVEVHLYSGTAIYNYDCQWKHIPKSAVHIDLANIDEELEQVVGERKEYYERRFFMKKKKNKRARASEDDEDLRPRHAGRFGPSSETGKAMEIDGRNLGGSDSDSDSDEDEEEEKEFPPLLLIFDDCVNENKIRHSPMLNWVMIAGRHMNINAVIFSQNFCGSGSVPPPIREQAEVIFIVAYPSREDARKLIEREYLTRGETTRRGAGIQLMSDVTATPHRAFVICKTDNTAREFPEYCFTYGPVPYDADGPCQCERSCGRAIRPVRKMRYGLPEQWEEDEKRAERKATRANESLVLYKPESGAKRRKRRRGEMSRNQTRTVAVRSESESSVLAPSKRRISMTGNIFGPSGTFRPGR